MDIDSEALFRKLKKDISTYVGLKFELLKLNTYERTGKVISILSYGVVLLLLGFFALLFIFLSLGFFLGEVFGSSGAGFGCVVILYLILIAIVVANKKRITDSVVNIVISSLRGNEEEQQDVDLETQSENLTDNKDEEQPTNDNATR
jgi:hypothetical protein